MPIAALAEPVTLALEIQGVPVVVVDHIPTGSVQFWAADHPLNPTDSNIVVCDLDTYVSLNARFESRRLVAFMVRDALRAVELKKKAAERRKRRNTKRVAAGSTQ